MLSISTSWISGKTKNAEKIIRETETLGVDAVELDYRIHTKTFNEMVPILKKSPLAVSSIHNFFPVPAELLHRKGCGDLFSLAHPDKEIRNTAVKFTTRTIEIAHSLEAPVIVLHCGYLDMESESHELIDLCKNGMPLTEKGIAFLKKQTDKLEKIKPAYLDALMFSIDKLLQVAMKEHVSLGLETRYYLYELPGYDDFDLLFKEFKGAPLGYWHDTGHARSQELQYLIPENGYLNRYGNKLIGMHIHDSEGFSDHMPPGLGEIDFKKVFSFIKPDTISVIELRSGYSTDEIKGGINHVRALIAENR